MRGIVQPVLIQQQGAGESTDLQQSVPVAGIARQTGDFQSHHDSGTVHADLSDEPLKSFPLDGAATGLALVAVDDHNLLSRPPKREGPIAQSILALAAFDV